MRRAAVVLALVSIATAQVAMAGTDAPPGYGTVKAADLYAGVEYVKLSKSQAPAVVAHVAHVLPGAAVELQVINARDRIASNTAELETTSSICRRVHCIAAVNGDFHKDGVPAGGVVIDGRMLRSPEPDRPQLTVLKDGRLVAGTVAWSGTVAAKGGYQLPLATVNSSPPANGLALFTPESGPSTGDSARVEVVVRGARIGAVNAPVNLELVSLRTGAGPIPADGAVLSGDGSAGEQLRDLWNRRQSAALAPRLTITSPLDADWSVGVEPVVLKDGKRATPWRDPNVINPTQPHTLVGWNREGHVFFVAVDGRQLASEGVNMAQAADFLQSLGATDAVSLDGGGGTVFVADGAVWNRPSDNDPGRPGAFVERGAPNALVLVPKPVAASPTIKLNSLPEPDATGTTVTSPGATVAPDADGGATDQFSSFPVDSGGLPIDPLAAHSSTVPVEAAPTGPAPNSAGRLAGPTGDTAAAAPTTPDSKATPTTAESGRDAGEAVSLSEEDMNGETLAAPASRQSSGEGGFPTPLLLLAGAVGGTGLLTAARRRTRPAAATSLPAAAQHATRPAAAAATSLPAAAQHATRPAVAAIAPAPPSECEPDPALMDSADEILLALERDLTAEPAPTAEPEITMSAVTAAEAEVTVDDSPDDEVSVDAYAVVLGGDGARQWTHRPAAEDLTIHPVGVAQLVDLREAYGLHELVLTGGTLATRPRAAANR